MLTFETLSKRRGNRAILTDLTFAARQGRVTGFLGSNGAGKSSALRILLGLDHASGGAALVRGTHYRALRDPLRTVGSMLDGSGAHRSRTARAHLRWVACSNGISRRRVGEVLEQVGLAEVGGRRAGTFSLGMGQRLGIATALLGEPEALVLDEPVNGLDPEGIRWIRGLLREHADRGGTVLVSSHLMNEVAAIADDLVVIADGNIAATGELSEIVAGHGTLESAFFALTRDARAADQ